LWAQKLFFVSELSLKVGDPSPSESVQRLGYKKPPPFAR